MAQNYSKYMSEKHEHRDYSVLFDVKTASGFYIRQIVEHIRPNSIIVKKPYFGSIKTPLRILQDRKAEFVKKYGKVVWVYNKEYDLLLINANVACRFWRDSKKLRVDISPVLEGPISKYFLPELIPTSIQNIKSRDTYVRVYIDHKENLANLIATIKVVYGI